MFATVAAGRSTLTWKHFQGLFYFSQHQQPDLYRLAGRFRLGSGLSPGPAVIGNSRPRGTTPMQPPRAFCFGLCALPDRVRSETENRKRSALLKVCDTIVMLRLMKQGLKKARPKCNMAFHAVMK